MAYACRFCRKFLCVDALGAQSFSSPNALRRFDLGDRGPGAGSLTVPCRQRLALGSVANPQVAVQITVREEHGIAGGRTTHSPRYMLCPYLRLVESRLLGDGALPPTPLIPDETAQTKAKQGKTGGFRNGRYA